MIDVSQWRASIGLWNYCQAASSRPANGHHAHSFKAAVDSKSGSTTSGEKTSKLPAALSHIAFLLLFYYFSLLRHILMIPPTGKQQLQLCTCIFTGILLLGNCYQVQCTTGVTVTDTYYLQSVVLPGGSSSNLIYNDLYLIVCLRMLLLLSGDVELNPGPMIDDRPDISLLTQWFHFTPTFLGLSTISDWIKCSSYNVFKMIDVSQWRASIGLWNYCQAASKGSIVFKKYCRPASSVPANELHQHQLIKGTAEDSQSVSTRYTQEDKRCTLPAVLFIIGFIIFYFCFLLLKHNSIPPLGKSIAIIHMYMYTVSLGHCYCYQVQCATGDIVTDTLQSVVLPEDINIFSLISRLLLLISGDVELNPGPTVEEG